MRDKIGGVRGMVLESGDRAWFEWSAGPGVCVAVMDVAPGLPCRFGGGRQLHNTDTRPKTPRSNASAACYNAYRTGRASHDGSFSFCTVDNIPTVNSGRFGQRRRVERGCGIFGAQTLQSPLNPSLALQPTQYATGIATTRVRAPCPELNDGFWRVPFTDEVMRAVGW